MAPHTRLVAAAAAALVGGGAAAGQVPTAPPPHPALAELAREYVRLGLPTPPADAAFVRYRYRGDPLWDLAFRAPPARPTARPRYWVNGSVRGVILLVEPDRLEPAGTGPDALRDLIDPGGDDHRLLAVQCRLRGWHDLARAVYALVKDRNNAAPARADDGEYEDPFAALRRAAWRYWEMDRLNEPGADRREPLRRLRAIAAEDAAYRTESRRDLLRGIELTLTTPAAPPGSVEALIDGLTEYTPGPTTEAGRHGRECYQKLLERGFDAVPALIAHVHDPRVTRQWNSFQVLTPNYRVRVGHVAVRLLAGLADGPRESWADPGGREEQPGGGVAPEKVRRWWAGAKAVGEERWLLDHAVPADPRGNEWEEPNPDRARVIGVKYPNRLAQVYRTILRRRRVESRTYADEIRTSTLPREQKVALLREGVGHAHPRHRYAALDALGRADPAAARPHLLRGRAAAPGRGPDTLSAGELAELTDRSGDQACWDALAAAAPRLTPWDREGVLLALGEGPTPGHPDPHRRDRLRILAGYLDNPTAEGGVEIRDAAADRLGLLLGFWPRYEARWGDYPENEVDRERGPLARLMLRAAARQAVDRELSQPGE